MSWHIEFAANTKDEARGTINYAMGKERIPVDAAEFLRTLVDSLSDGDPKAVIHVKSHGHIGSGPSGADAQVNSTFEVRLVSRHV